MEVRARRWAGDLVEVAEVGWVGVGLFGSLRSVFDLWTVDFLRLLVFTNLKVYLYAISSVLNEVKLFSLSYRSSYDATNGDRCQNGSDVLELHSCSTAESL